MSSIGVRRVTLSLALFGVATSGACGGDKGAVTVGTGGAGGNGKIVTGSGGAAGTGSGGTAGTGSGGAAGTGSGGAAGNRTIDSGESVIMHHKHLSRDGLYVQPTLKKDAVTATFNKDPGFNAVLDANEPIYAQPLFVDGGAGGQDLIIVATAQNNVYAFDAVSGTKVWKTNLGAPVALANMPCGNLDPYGVTGTPVIDLASGKLFVDAMTTPDGGTTKKHLIFELSIAGGAINPSWTIDVGAKVTSGSTTFNNAPQSERGALAILNGTLYVPYGGLYGDCGSYHGWLVAVSIADPTQIAAWATTAQSGGAWAPGGASSDGTSIFLTTGNTVGGTSTSSWGGGEGLLRFTPGASFTTPAFWAPMNWVMLDNGDLDIGGTGAIPFDLPGSAPSTLAVAFGKDGNVYLLDRNNLGGVSDPIVKKQVATNEIITAPTLYTTATATYVVSRGNGGICSQGSGDLMALKIVPGSPPTIAGSWCAAGGAGSPMVTTSDGQADAIVWTLGVDANQTLNAFDGDSGAAIPYPGKSVAIPGMRRFNTPIAAKGRIYVPADGMIVAFKL
jgi:hypothetical protein